MASRLRQVRYVKGLSETTACEVEEEWKRGGEFRSLFDFLERTCLKREAMENLIACGAFDCFGLERRELLWQLGLIYRSDGRSTSERQLALPLPTQQDMVALAPMSDWERMVWAHHHVHQARLVLQNQEDEALGGDRFRVGVALDQRGGAALGRGAQRLLEDRGQAPLLFRRQLT